MTDHETYDVAQEAAMVDAYMNAHGIGPARETTALTSSAAPLAAPAGELDPGDVAKVDAYIRHHFPKG